jgi:hypothetical protein
MLFMAKNVYVVQPYEVGTKERKSLAIIIPAKITRAHHINTSTIFALGVDEKTTRITLREVYTKDEDEEKKMAPAYESFQASSKQVSTRGH